MAAKVRVDINDAGIQSMIQPGGILYAEGAVIGDTVSTVAKLRVGVDTGRLRQSIKYRLIVQRTQLTIRVSARPKYARIHHEGRRAIQARPGKVLRFRAKNGTIVYTRRVKGVKGNPFLADAVRVVTGKTPRRLGAGAGD